METNKAQMKQMKEWLKAEAIELRKLKNAIKIEARAGHIGAAGTLQSNLFCKKDEYRHKHIAYSMAKGKTYEQIESSVIYGHEPRMKLIQSYLDDLCESEAIA